MSHLYNKLLNLFKLNSLSHPQHALLGLAQIGVGIVLILNDFYFFWPPFLIGFLNDDLIGGCGIIFGFLMIRWAFSDKDPIKTNRNLLLFSTFYWGFEATAEAIHGYIAGRPHMFTASILECILLLFTLHLIGQSEKHKY